MFSFKDRFLYFVPDWYECTTQLFICSSGFSCLLQKYTILVCSFYDIIPPSFDYMCRACLRGRPTGLCPRVGEGVANVECVVFFLGRPHLRGAEEVWVVYWCLYQVLSGTTLMRCQYFKMKRGSIKSSKESHWSSMLWFCQRTLKWYFCVCSCGQQWLPLLHIDLVIAIHRKK